MDFNPQAEYSRPHYRGADILCIAASDRSGAVLLRLTGLRFRGSLPLFVFLLTNVCGHLEALSFDPNSIAERLHQDS